jgi:trigger factor
MAEHNHGHTHNDHTHTEPVEQRGEQKVTVEDAGPARKSLTIEIPADRIKKKIEDNFGKLKDDAVLPGFRRGRAPQRLLEKRFGTSLRDEVRGQLLSESYSQAVEDEKLDVIGEPDIKDFDKITLPESGPLTYKVEVEVSPKVELPPLDGLEVNKPKLEVDDAKVTAEIERLRERYGKMVDAPDVAVGPEDFVQSEVRVLAGENVDPADEKAEQISQQSGVYIHVAGESRQFKGHVVGIVVDDLGKRMAGKKVGDVVTVSMTGPVSHENDKIKGKPITIVIRLEKVERLAPAELDALPAQLGLESVEQLKERVKQMLEQRRDNEQQAAMHKQLADMLLEKVKLDLPEGLTGRQAGRVLQRQAMEMSYRGVPEREIETKIAELRASSEEDARKQLKLFFILDQAAKDLNIEVSEQEVNGRIAMLARQQNRRPEKLRQQMQRSGEIEHLYLQIREQKTLDKVIEKAKVTEVDAPATPETT